MFFQEEKWFHANWNFIELSGNYHIAEVFDLTLSLGHNTNPTEGSNVA